jgi:RNA polymerase sigma factor (sigma-70 family)
MTPRDQLILANTGLAYRLANALWQRDPVIHRLGEREDVQQEALRFLVVAAGRYDPARPSAKTGRPVKFCSYAGVVIANELKKAALAAGLVHVPAYFGRRASEQRYALQAERALFPRPLDDQGHDADPPDRPHAEEPAADELDRLQRALGRLPRRLAGILRRRLGLGCERESLAELGTRLSLSKEGVRLLEKQALGRLRELLWAS